MALFETDRAVNHLRRGDVHQTRRSLKRLRALLALLSGDKTAAAIEARLQKAGRLLSPVRDREVALALYREIRPLLPHALQRRLSQTVKPLAALPPCLPPTVLPLLERSRRALERWTPDTTPKLLRREVCRTYRKARTIYRSIRAGEYSAESLHKLRRVFKRLEAQLELLHDRAPSRLLKASRTVRKIGERLGNDHDLVVLAHLFPEESRELLAPWLQPLQRKHRRAVLRLAERFFNKTGRVQ